MTIIHQEFYGYLKKTKRQQIILTNVAINNCTSFKYSSCFTEVTYADGVNGKATNTKIAVSLKYFSAL